MVIVYVEHYLNDAGQKLFPKWIKKVAGVLQSCDGFISIRRITLVDRIHECHLLLEFEALDKLKAWATSEAHKGFIDELIPYRRQKQTSRIYEENERFGKV